MKELSIVIITWNSQQYISACMDALIQSVSAFNYQLFIVDNGSTDETLSILNNYLSYNSVLIKNKKNKGVAHARNQALQLVTTDKVLLLDIDTVVNEQAINELVAYIDTNTEVGICAPKLLSIDDEVQLSCRKFPSFRYKFYNLLASKNIFLKRNQSQFYIEQMKGNAPFEVEYVIGACQLIRKAALNQVGLLDEHIFYGPEDADLCLRMWNARWKVVYLPSVSIIHHYQQITRKKVFSVLTWKHAKALAYYFWKHKRF
jgi:GT2 family glycosyltransferase